ncbi:uncharacterized protein PAC_05085 [Phialocephala subalpina]|uniref:Uncharacterized protein n=1 Tax=Phialocephala subalpina TaxID=576137 RepID=A0A1L7WQZ5_9HELO|nr:uncharacterized protein PAC_05085 [Phialocephala subalpina]
MANSPAGGSLRGGTDDIPIDHTVEHEERWSPTKHNPNHQPGTGRTITNPFRRRQLQRAQAADDADPEVTNVGDTSNESAPQYPTRPVFNDLQTAHMSITSRNARIRAATILPPPALPREPAIIPDGLVASTSVNFNTLQELSAQVTPRDQPTEADFEEIHLGDAVRPPNPQEQFDIEEQAIPKRQPSILSRVWNGLVGSRRISTAIPATDNQEISNARAKTDDDQSVYRSHSTTSSTASSIQPNLPNGLRQDEHRVNRLPRDGLCLPNLQFSSSPAAAANPWLQGYPREFSGESGHTNLSLPEGSTVGEIYRHYQATDVSQGGRMGVLNQKSMSDQNVDKDAPESPQVDPDPRHSEQTSYGDSQDLLEVEEDRDQVSNAAMVIPTIGIETVHSEHALSVAISTVPSLTQVNWRNRYSLTPEGCIDTRNENRASLFSVSHGRRASESAIPRAEDFDSSQTSIDSRRPLERDISQELRRVSAYSQDSIEQSVYQGFADRYQRVTDGNGNFLARQSLDTDSIDSIDSIDDNPPTVPPPLSTSPTFYNTAAIPAQWIGSHENVRIPIGRPEIPPRSPRRPAPPEATFPPFAPTSARGHDRSQSRDVDDWETIGESQWSLELPNGGTNGAHPTGSSIAGTSDAGSTSMFTDEAYGSTDRIAQHPAPLSGHTHYRMRDLTSCERPVLLPVYNQYRINGYPANSSRLRPPTLAYQNPEPLQRQHNNPFDSPPPEILSPKQSGSKQSRRSRIFNGRAKSKNRFPPTKSTITSDGSGATAHRADTIRRRRSSNHTKSLSETHGWIRGAVSLGSAVDGRHLQSERTTRNDRPTSWGLIQAHANGESVEGYSLKDGQITPNADRFDGVDVEEPVNRPQQGRQRLPTGSLYNSLRGKTSTRQRQLRPDTPMGDFKFRSPLAPPKSLQSRHMYSPSKLIEMEEFARADGLVHERGISTGEGPSQKHIYEAPVITIFEDEHLNPLQEQMLNRVCLAICCLFPPFLLCFAFSFLDSLLEWKMDGNVRKFGKSYKKWAFILFWAEMVIIVVCVAVSTALKQKALANAE